MPDDRNCGGNYSGNGGPFGGLLSRHCGGGCGGNGDSTILFFIIIFLLLFTNFGCGGCGCNN